MTTVVLPCGVDGAADSTGRAAPGGQEGDADVAGDRRWVVTCSGERDLAQVAEDLRARGLRHGQALGEIGIIVGEAPDEVADSLRSVPGVSDVSPDRPIDTGPPDAPTTW